MNVRTVTVTLEVRSNITALRLEKVLRSTRVVRAVLDECVTTTGPIFEVKQIDVQVIDATKGGDA